MKHNKNKITFIADQGKVTTPNFFKSQENRMDFVQCQKT